MVRHKGTVLLGYVPETENCCMNEVSTSPYCMHEVKTIKTRRKE